MRILWGMLVGMENALIGGYMVIMLGGLKEVSELGSVWFIGSMNIELNMLLFEDSV